jgi:hypothetical protein
MIKKENDLLATDSRPVGSPVRLSAWFYRIRAILKSIVVMHNACQKPDKSGGTGFQPVYSE